MFHALKEHANTHTHKRPTKPVSYFQYFCYVFGSSWKKHFFFFFVLILQFSICFRLVWFCFIVPHIFDFTDLFCRPFRRTILLRLTYTPFTNSVCSFHEFLLDFVTSSFAYIVVYINWWEANLIWILWSCLI